ncbi:MAG TPA: DUF2232 domain-containing protein [Symbiobacteriaceae bacterium]|nr:DUF2232 domain-containing protein [Symbiobacteriaceae bacterium]
MQRRSGVQGLVFGGIMAGILLLCALIPFLGIFLPIPLVLVYVRYGGRTAVMTAVVSALLTAMFKGPIQAFLLTVPSGILPGLAFGYGFRHKLKPLTIGLLAVAIFFLGYAADYMVMRVAVLGGQDPLENALATPEGREQMETFLKFAETMATAQPAQTAQTEAQKAYQQQQLALIAEVRANPVGVFWSILPMGVFLLGVLSTWLNYLLCRAVLPRFGHEVPRPSPFSQFRVPAWILWIYLLSSMGLGYMGNSLANAPWWVKILINVASPLAWITALAGVAAAYGWLRIKQNMAKFASVAVVLAPFLFLGQTMLMMYIFLAMWDSIFDFRGLGHGIWKRRQPEETP